MPSLLHLLLPALLIALPAQAARTLRLVFDEMPPWQVLRDGQYAGVYVDIIREIGRRTGLDVGIVTCPLKRCLYMLETGNADIAIGYKETAERKRYLHYLSTPYRQRSADRVFYVLRDRGVEVRDYADLSGLRIGIKHGAEYFERFDKDTVLLKAPVRDMEANFRKLTLGRLDAVLIPEDQGDAMITKLGMRHLVTKSAYRQADMTSRAVAIALNSPFAARIGDFEQAMAAMARDGTLDALYRRNEHERAAATPFPGAQ